MRIKIIILIWFLYEILYNNLEIIFNNNIKIYIFIFKKLEVFKKRKMYNDWDYIKKILIW